MNKLGTAAVLAVLVGFGAQTAHAQTATVSYVVDPINELAISGDVSLVISSATAGSQPNNATGSGTYDITSNGTNKRITASLNEAMPAGTTLTLLLGAPTGASATAVDLNAVAQNVVTGITTVVESGLSIGYTLSATVAAGVVSGNRTVLFTITDF